MYACLLQCLADNMNLPQERVEGCALSDVARRTLPVAVQLQNDGEWIFLQDWPPKDTTTRVLYLDSPSDLVGAESESGGDGYPSAKWLYSELSYIYDAAKPTPARGGPSFSIFNSVSDRREP